MKRKKVILLVGPDEVHRFITFTDNGFSVSVFTSPGMFEEHQEVNRTHSDMIVIDLDSFGPCLKDCEEFKMLITETSGRIFIISSTSHRRLMYYKDIAEAVCYSWNNLFDRLFFMG